MSTNNPYVNPKTYPEVKKQDKEEYERKKEKDELERKETELRYQKMLEDRS